MNIVLSNDRVRLRELRLDDWPDIHAYSRLPEVCRYQPWGPNTPEQSRTFVEATVTANAISPRTHYDLAATLPGSDRVIGLGTLSILDEQSRVGAIGYFLHPEHWGKGLATEVGRLLLAFGFAELKLHRIQGTCDPRNVASARVMQKLGMRHEGRLRETMLIRDGWRDSDVYGIVEQEWARDQGLSRWPFFLGDMAASTMVRLDSNSSPISPRRTAARKT